MTREGNKKQLGFTLVEIMIALVLGLVLIGGTVTMFVVNSSTQSFVQENSRLQENARYALTAIVDQVRAISFLGCNPKIDLTSSSSSFVNIVDVTSSPNSFFYDLANQGTLIGYDDPSSFPITTSTGSLDSSAVSNTDVLVIRSADTEGSPVTVAQSGTSGSITIADSDYVTDASDVLLITDCVQAALFSAGATGSVFSPIASISNTDAFDTDAVVYKFDSKVFYIADSSVDDSSGNSVPALYEQTNGTDVELVRGISDLQLLWGIDTDSDDIPNQFVTATNLTAFASWDDVVSVRIQITAQPVEDIVIDSDSGGRDFVATVDLRNR